MTATTVDVRTLSVRQPWADLLLSGVKPVENRTWATTWRGLMLIHAGTRVDPHGYEFADQVGTELPDGPLVGYRGGYLGTVEVVDVHPDTGCCRPWGLTGCWHWVVTTPRRFGEPVPAAGRLGLYRPDPLVAALAASETGGASW